MGCTPSTEQPQAEPGQAGPSPAIKITSASSTENQSAGAAVNTSSNAKTPAPTATPAAPPKSPVQPPGPGLNLSHQANKTSVQPQPEQTPPATTSLAPAEHGEKKTKVKVDQTPSKTSTKQTDIVSGNVETEDVSQKQFDTAVGSACLLMKPDCLQHLNRKHVTALCLQRALPSTFSLNELLGSLKNLKELDLSNNQLGPQGVRAVCLAMGSNSTIVSLNIAGNKTDTDTAECLGKLLELNTTLQYLDVSSNYLGKDYFSRCVGPKLKHCKLTTLKAQSIGSTDVEVFIENLVENKHLVDLDLSSNEITDRLVLGQGISSWLKNPDCCLRSLSLGQCDISPAGLGALRDGLKVNKSLTDLNLSGNECGSLKLLHQFLCTAFQHPSLNILSMDDMRVTDCSLEHVEDEPMMESTSPLRTLSLQNCALTDEFWVLLVKGCEEKMLQLTDLDISSNDKLSPCCMKQIMKLTSSTETSSSLSKLSYSLNDAINLFEELLSENFPNLQYLSIRKAKLPATSIEKLSPLIRNSSLVESVNLDGLKLSGTPVLKVVLEKPEEIKLTSLSLGGCSLEDSDLSPLADAIEATLQLHMLKLSGNRITNSGISKLVAAIVSHGSYPLAVLDVSNNRIEDAGAIELSKIFSSKDHKSKLHSLNLSANCLGQDGLSALVSCIGGASPLSRLYLHLQENKLLESQTEDILHKLALTLGFAVEKDGSVIKSGCSNLPKLPDGLIVNMTKIGGHPGEMAKMIDSTCIMTDHMQSHLPYLSFAHVMDICASIKGLEDGVCVWSDKEWKLITGASRSTSDVPSWLQIPSNRALAMYLSNLPGNATQQKLESLLEMEADCNLDEVCLMKDPVTRTSNGSAWVLMCDKESLQRAEDFFLSDQAVIFGQPFLISPVCVSVDDEASVEVERKARLDMENRLVARKHEDIAHRNLIRQNAEESWKRHAYRLAHPAYADGRIW